MDLRGTTSKHLGKMGTKETTVGADVVHHRTVFLPQPGGAEFQLDLISSTMVEWKIGKIAGVTHEIVAEPACRHEALDTDGAKSLQPGQPRSGTHQWNVRRGVRGNGIRTAAHHLNATADNAHPQPLPPRWTVADPARLRCGFALFMLSEM